MYQKQARGSLVAYLSRAKCWGGVSLGISCKNTRKEGGGLSGLELWVSLLYTFSHECYIFSFYYSFFHFGDLGHLGHLGLLIQTTKS